MSKALQIKDFPDYYITDTGDVYSRKISYKHNPDGRIKKLCPAKDRFGYLMVRLSKNKKGYPKKIHRLVSEAFIPNPENKKCVNHKNGIKTDNRVENLEWSSYSENNTHAYRVLGKKSYWKDRKGELCHLSKPVLQIKDNKIVGEFPSITDAERKTAINHSHISACCKKRKGYKTVGGYNWEYKEKTGL